MRRGMWRKVLESWWCLQAKVYWAPVAMDFVPRGLDVGLEINVHNDDPTVWVLNACACDVTK